ncbi:hypothetical protein ACHAPQ_007267 [Fusarium lateritium]
MNKLAFTLALLGVTGVLSESDQGEMEMDSWCVTYVSTYLAPVSNQEDRPTINSEQDKSTVKDSGSLPSILSIRPTSGKNTYPPREEQSVSEGLSSASTASDLDSISRIDVIPASTSNEIVPTSSGIVEPEGRSIIFQVSIPENDKRSINKRATRGFEQTSSIESDATSYAISVPPTLPSSSTKDLSTDLNTETVELNSLPPASSTVEPTSTIPESIETSTGIAETTVESLGTTTEPVGTIESIESSTELERQQLLPRKSTETVDIPTEDACVEGLTDPTVLPLLKERKDDCSSNNVITVSPSTVTITETLTRRFVWVIPTSWPPSPTKKRVARDEDEATTIFPTEYPDTYATYCDNAEDYYKACSSLGVTQSTTTLPTSTTTEDNPACRAKQMVNTAGEAMGYKSEKHWELMIMPGYTMIAI